MLLRCGNVVSGRKYSSRYRTGSRVSEHPESINAMMIETMGTSDKWVSYFISPYSLGGFFLTDKTYAENPRTPTIITAVVTLSNASTECFGRGGAGSRFNGK